MKSRTGTPCSEINQQVDPAKEDRSDCNDIRGDLEIDHLFQVVNNKGAGVGHGGIVAGSKKGFQVSQGAIPVQGLDQGSEAEGKQVETLYPPMAHSPKSPNKKKNNPGQMEDNCQVGQDFINHLGSGGYSRAVKFFMLFVFKTPPFCHSEGAKRLKNPFGWP